MTQKDRPLMSPIYSPENQPKRLAEDGAITAEQMQDLGTVFSIHTQKIANDHGERMRKAWADLLPLFGGFSEAAKGGASWKMRRTISATHPSARC